ncbi:endonuclease III [bacterium]|nr:endonuclease III [bacterium]
MKKIEEILKRLEKEIPEAHTALNYRSPLELLVATILSAQCTDERVNMVIKTLFKKYKSAQDYASSNLKELEEDIRPTGFYKNKAKAIKGSCQVIITKFGEKVPKTMEELTTLPGVGRKTANVVLGSCFGQPAIVVDTHVRRVSQRLGLVKSDDPEKIEKELSKMIPKSKWIDASHRLLLFGRHICKSRKPLCSRCTISPFCKVL